MRRLIRSPCLAQVFLKLFLITIDYLVQVHIFTVLLFYCLLSKSLIPVLYYCLYRCVSRRGIIGSSQRGGLRRAGL